MRFRLSSALRIRDPQAASRRGREQRGAVAIEAALLIPVLAVFFMGMVDLGLFMRSNIAVTTLAREGARTASSESRLQGFTKDTADAITRSAVTLSFDRVEVTIYKAGNPYSLPPEICSDDCTRYSGWVDTKGFETVEGEFDPTSIVACLGAPDASYIGVYVRARHDWLFNPFGSSTTYVTGRTVMKSEPVIPDVDAPDFRTLCR